MNNITKEIETKMKEKNEIIILNTESKNPLYRMLVQTGEEIPGHDIGYDKIRYNPETIKSKIKQLEGRFVYDETQSEHNKRQTPESRGHKFAKINNTGYCPEYGGYVDLEIFDKNYHDLMESALNSVNDGLPLYEGPSTEVKVNTAQIYDDNNLDVVDWDYTGLVWDDNPRDNHLGVCKVLNSIKEVLEEEDMSEIVKIDKDEYDSLKTKEQELGELETKYNDGEGLYNKGKKLYDELKVEVEDLKKQLIPIWESQATEKVAMVNSILETIPKKEQDAQKEILEGMDVKQLGIIVNSLPEPGSRGVPEQGATNPAPEDEAEFTYDMYKKMCKERGMSP